MLCRTYIGHNYNRPILNILMYYMKPEGGGVGNHGTSNKDALAFALR